MKSQLWEHREDVLYGVNLSAGILFFVGVFSEKRELIPINIAALAVCVFCKILLFWNDSLEEKKEAKKLTNPDGYATLPDDFSRR